MANITRRQEPTGTIGRWDPFRLMREMMGRDFPDISSFFEMSPFRELEGLRGQRVFQPELDVSESKDRYTICADLPGVKDKDVDVSVEGNRLTISGHREEERREEGEQRYMVERSYGSFTRSFTLPESADLEGIQADLKEGVLRIEIPKKAGVSSRQIPVRGKTSGELVEGRAEEGKAEEGRAEEGRAEEGKGVFERGVEKGREVLEKGKEMLGKGKEGKEQKAA